MRWKIKEKENRKARERIKGLGMKRIRGRRRQTKMECRIDPTEMVSDVVSENQR